MRVRVLIRSDKHNGKACAVGAGGPREFVVVAEVPDSTSVSGEEGDVFALVGEVADEFSGDGNSRIFDGKVSGFSNEHNPLFRGENRDGEGAILIKVKSNAADEFYSAKIDSIIANIHEFDELHGIVVAEWMVVEFRDDEVSDVGGNSVDEEGGLIECAPSCS